jgi:hypothetical protein
LTKERPKAGGRGRRSHIGILTPDFAMPMTSEVMAPA